MFNDIDDKEKNFVDNKNNKLIKTKNGDFFKGLSPWFWSQIGNFSISLFQ